MPAPDRVPARGPLLALAVLLLGACPAPAYTGPGAGIEFVDSFRGLLVWVGAACFAALLWPCYVLLRCLWREREAPKAVPLASPPLEPPETVNSTDRETNPLGSTRREARSRFGAENDPGEPTPQLRT